MFRARLRTNITIITMLLMGILLTLVTMLTFTVSREIIDDNVNQNANAQVKIHSQYLTNWLGTRLAEMEMMSVSSEIQSQDEETILTYLNSEMARQEGLYLSFSLSDQKGYAYSNQRIYSHVGEDDAFQQALEGTPTISNPVPSLENPNNLIVRFYVPVRNEENTVTHVLFGESKINTVFKENTNFQYGQNDVVYLVNHSGEVIYHPDKQKILTHQLATGTKEEQLLLTHLQETKNGVYASTFFAEVANTDWFLMWDVPKKELTASLNDLLQVSFSSIILAVFFMGILMFLLLNNMFKRLQKVVRFTEEISQGNINIDPIPIKRSDEIGALTHANNQMLQSLKGVFHQLNEGVSRSATNVFSSSQELSTSAEETMNSSKQIASMIEQVTAESEKQTRNSEQNVLRVNEMLEGIHQITLAANEVKDHAEKTDKKAKNGTMNMAQTKEQMERIQQAVHSSVPKILELKARSNEIEKFLDVINGLTNNINLLSLNASIEAARAGEHGKGFSVVAEEVKKLAQETAQSAHQIAKLIHQTQENVKDTEDMMQLVQQEVAAGSKVTEETALAFEDISSSVGQVTRQILDVSSVSEELVAGSEQMLDAFNAFAESAKNNSLHFYSVSSASEQQVASMQHMAEYADELANMAQNLRELIQQVNL